MPVSTSIQHFLEDSQINYAVIHHAFSQSAYDSACSAHIPISNMIKSIVLRDRHDGRYIIAMIPASNKLKLSWANRALGRDLLLAREMELSELFPDCRLGAVPAMGQPYGIKMIWDDSLKEQHDLYFEAGDHEDLIHLDQQQFDQLFQQQAHSIISMPAEHYSLYHSDEMRSSFM